jgi:NADH-quinone oxidoreductase subunit L
MRKMGGLKDKIPYTFWTFAVGTLAIAGIYPFAGFFSKDEILASALAGGWPVLFGVGLFTAMLTAFYMSRLLFGTFFGSYRGDLESAHAHGGHGAAHGHDAQGGHGGIHESPWSMLGPLVALAAGSIVAGFVHVPAFVAPAVRVEAPEPHFAWLPWLASAAALAGIALGYYLYVMRPELPARISASLGPLQRLLEAKYHFDDVYNAFASRVVVGGSDRALWKAFDTAVIDGAVNGAGKLVGAMSMTARYVQTGLVRGYALVILGGAVALLYYLLWLR